MAGRLTFRVRANPAAPPLVGPCAFRLGRGTSPTATQTARAPYPAFKTFELPAHWDGFLLDPAIPSPPLRVAADGTVRGPLPAGLTPAPTWMCRVCWSRKAPMCTGTTCCGCVASRLRRHPSARVPSAPLASARSTQCPTRDGSRRPPSILAIHRATPTVPPLVYPPVNFATRADYHGTSWFLLAWTGVAGLGYLVYRAGDLDLLAAAGIDLAVHRARTADEQRLELQQLALDPAHIEAFRIVTAAPLASSGGAMRVSRRSAGRGAEPVRVSRARGRSRRHARALAARVERRPA